MLLNKTKNKIFLYLVCTFIIFTPLITNAEIPFLGTVDKDDGSTIAGEAFTEDLNVTAGGAGYGTTKSPDGIIALRMKLTQKAIQYVLGFLGILFFGLILMGGYEWMFAGGNEERVTKAQKRIRMAVNGLIIVLAAYALAYFIFNALSANTIKPI